MRTKRKVTKRKSFFDIVEENHKNDNIKKLFQLAPFTHSKKKPVKKTQQPTKGKWDSRKVTNKLRREHPFGDYDRDNVPNYRDCQPYDRTRHGVEPTELMKERMDMLPIYVTDLPIPSDIDRFIDEKQYYHFLLDPKARSLAPVARKRILSIIKRYPDLISQIKRKRPTIILVTSKEDPEGEALGIAYPCEHERGVVVIYAPSEKVLLKAKKAASVGIRRPGVAAEGGTLRHELEHIKQFRDVRMKKDSMSRLFKGKYEDQPGEKEARKAERRLHQKHLKERPEEETLEFVRREFDKDYERDYERDYDENNDEY